MRQIWQTADSRLFRTEEEAKEWEDLEPDRRRIADAMLDSGLVENSIATALADWLVDRAFIEAERARAKAKKERKG